MSNVAKYYKIVFISTILFLLNQNAFSQSMNDSSRAIQQSNDIRNLNAEQRICQNTCISNFKRDALAQPGSANQIVNQCQ